MGIEAVINVAVEVVGAVKPWAHSNEDASGEPLGPVVPIWSAVCTGRSRSSHTGKPGCSDIDGDLGGFRVRYVQQSDNQGGKGKKFPRSHKRNSALFKLALAEGNYVSKVSGLCRNFDQILC